jgi:hypothetical protein
MDKRLSDRNQVQELEDLDRKISIATEGFATDRFCALIIGDRDKLSKENALTICEYIIAMGIEINCLDDDYDDNNGLQSTYPFLQNSNSIIVSSS